MDDDVILRVVEDGAIAREKDNDEKDECAIIIIVVVVVVVVVAIFVLLFSLSFPCVFLLGEKKWRRREKGFHRNIKTSRKGGVSSFHVMPLSKKGPPSSSSSFLKKKKRKGKFGWIRSIFLQKIGGQNFIAISRAFFSLFELYVDPQLIEYIPKKRRARAPSEGAFGTKTKETSRPITTITTTTTKHEEEELAQTCTNTRDDDSTTTTKCRRIRWRN